MKGDDAYASCSSGKYFLRDEVESIMGCAQALPVFDPAAGTLTFNVTIVSNPASIKFPGGIARLTYEKAVAPSAYAKVCPFVDQGVWLKCVQQYGNVWWIKVELIECHLGWYAQQRCIPSDVTVICSPTITILAVCKPFPV